MTCISNSRDMHAPILEQVCEGVWKAPNARVIDRSGRSLLPIGNDDFVSAMRENTLVDKTALIADVLGSGYKATLFCRPRRFGKTLNMSMFKAFFEAPEAGGLTDDEARALFAGTAVWEMDGGLLREHLGAYPVVNLSLRTAKAPNWEDSLSELRSLVADEYLRHAYLREEGTPLAPEDVDFFNSIVRKTASDADFARSLAALCRMLLAYHGTGAVILIDEYDVPVMAGYTCGYYDQAVPFLKTWLTGALKGAGEALAFACLTGVQRISKESIFSDLNNLYVSTALTTRFDERYGFTDAEVQALATYLGRPGCVEQAREWYDGYRFGVEDIYNPWSVINYLDAGCKPDIYWGNTSSNSVVGDLVAHADAGTLDQVYALLEPGGTVDEPLDLGVVFPDIGVREGALWSMLYLAGYLTTDDTDFPNDDTRLRPLRIPNREIARLYRNEVVRRFRADAGGPSRLAAPHRALLAGDVQAFEAELGEIAAHASSLDLTGELPCHMLLMGLLFGMPGYCDSTSNREAGYGRYDIRIEPDSHASGRSAASPRPLVTVEVKYLRDGGRSDDADVLQAELGDLAVEGLKQIAERGYDAGTLPPAAVGRLRWGVAFCGKRVAAACEHVE